MLMRAINVSGTLGFLHDNYDSNEKRPQNQRNGPIFCQKGLPDS
jgi:hypothetical protein